MPGTALVRRCRRGCGVRCWVSCSRYPSDRHWTESLRDKQNYVAYRACVTTVLGYRLLGYPTDWPDDVDSRVAVTGLGTCTCLVTVSCQLSCCREHDHAIVTRARSYRSWSPTLGLVGRWRSRRMAVRRRLTRAARWSGGRRRPLVKRHCGGFRAAISRRRCGDSR